MPEVSRSRSKTPLRKRRSKYDADFLSGWKQNSLSQKESNIRLIYRIMGFIFNVVYSSMENCGKSSRSEMFKRYNAVCSS